MGESVLDAFLGKGDEMFDKILIETAREFPAKDAVDVVDIASIRTERTINPPADNQRGNNYIKVLDHFENGRPVFRWENWGGI